MQGMSELLSVEGLKIDFPTREGTARAVEDVSFAVQPGEVFGLVGESGSGKTTLGRCMLGLYRPTTGEVLLDGENILAYDARALRQARKKMQMVFQDPYSSLNPRLTVRQALTEVLLVHHICSRAQANAEAERYLHLVGLPLDALDRFPHEFSGGQRQRIGIARALAVQPELIIADEPVSALDVSVQAQVINLLMELQEELRVAMMMIAHDLRLVRYISHRVAVMYLGKIVETAPCEALFSHPLHPYTCALLAAAPKIDTTQRPGEARIAGEPPSALNVPPGCRFHTRCDRAAARCKVEQPEWVEVERGHFAACHNI